VNRIGIVQGRLSPPVDGRIQAFPRDTWREEFPRARSAGLQCLEWIYETAGAETNPIASREGVAELRDLVATHGVSVAALCADYLMEHPVLAAADIKAGGASDVVAWLVEQCRQARIARLVLPFVGGNAVRSTEDGAEIGRRVRAWAALADAASVDLHLETSLGPAASRELLDRIAHSRVWLTYDIGNSIQFGYRATDELPAYGARIGSVHVKDAMRGGTTVRLGTGHADFDYCFRYLAALDYRGDYVIQGARVAGADDVELAREYRAFVQRHLAVAAGTAATPGVVVPR